MRLMTTRRTIAALLFLLVFLAPAASASVLVLVHGYLSDGQTFERSGILAALETAGWHYGGEWVHQPDGRVGLTRANGTDERTVYTVSLPATAPLMLQAQWLTAMRQTLEQRHAEAPVTWVGHSAGGVVARLALVHGGAGQAVHLITIASPHLGTERAVQALEATRGGGMFGPFRQILTRQALGGDQYDTLRYSQALLADLVPPQPGTLLGWLNVQPHPDIAYDAVVRNTNFRMGGDVLVPAWSQDLNQVPALRGRATVITSPLAHDLSATDARLILDRLAAQAR